MHFASINWWAVLVCVAVSMIVGSVWFGPKTFFPVWWKAIGKTQSDVPGIAGAMGVTWALLVLCSCVQALFMALMVNAMGSMMPNGATLGGGALTGFVLWLGFVGPASLTNKLFAGRIKAWALETGNHLIVFVLFGAILGVWR